MFFLPVRDENPTYRAPMVNRLLIVLNVVVFLLELWYGDPFVVTWSFLPVQFSQFLAGDGGTMAPLTILTSMFLHGSWGHLLGNMLFLWLFGDNVEDAYGHGGYALFYLACGVLATLAQYISEPNSPVISLGASGAISGVLGSYILMYPRVWVQIFFFPFSFFFGNIGVPAWLMLGLWFLAQLTPALRMMGQITGGGVAYWAHVGGFVAGLLLTMLIRPKCRTRPYYHNARFSA